MTPFYRAWPKLVLSLLLVSSAVRGAELLSASASGTNACNAGVGELFCVNADGRFAAFASGATNIVVPDTNAFPDLFVRDCELRSIVWSTVGSAGSSGGSAPLQFTPDGRYLLFSSTATNLVTNINLFAVQLYRRDLLSNETALVSVSYDGTNSALKTANAGGMTPDGRFVFFTTAATNIVAGVNSGTFTFAYLRDMVAGTNELITASPDGLALDRTIFNCRMSTNARFFAFDSAATNVVPGLTNTSGSSQVYWRDQQAGTNLLVSANLNGGFASNGASLKSLSRDGRFVCFDSLATNIVTGQNDFNGTQDLFIRDMVAGETWLVSRATNGNTTGSRVTGGAFSVNGQWLLLSPAASDLVPGVASFSGASRDLYLHNVSARTNLLVSRSVSGVTGASGYVTDGFATLSASGRYVVFDTTSTNLLPGGTTTLNRLLLRDCVASQTLTPLPGIYAVPPYNYGHYLITEDERYVFFLGSGPLDPAVTDGNGAPDLFRTRLRASELQPLVPGGAIQGQGLALGTYILQTSSNLLNWTDAVTNIADSNGVFSVSDPQPPGDRRYFRLKTP